MMEKKYKLTEETTIVNDRTLYRIETLKDFGNVKKGDKGGFIENENNLSQSGDCGVYGDAMVFEDARIYGKAKIYDDAMVFEDARIYGNARVLDNAVVRDNAKVHGFAVVRE